MPLQLEPLKARSCQIGRYIASADPADAKTIQSWLDDPSIVSGRLARSLTASGFSTSDKTVIAHRSGQCCCGAN